MTFCAWLRWRSARIAVDTPASSACNDVVMSEHESARGRETASSAADEIRQAHFDGDDEAAYRAFVQLSNDLVDTEHDVKGLLGAEQPDSVSPEWDAAIAGLVEWRLRQAGLPTPAWVDQVRGDVTWRWAPWPAIRVIKARIDRVPEPFAKRGIWIEEGELDSA